LAKVLNRDKLPSIRNAYCFIRVFCTFRDNALFMPFYHALFKNNRPTKDDDDASHWTSGGEYTGPFSEEFPRERLQPGVDAELVVVHFFKSEDELLRFHQTGGWKNYITS
jgi:hypothetical protein